MHASAGHYRPDKLIIEDDMQVVLAAGNVQRCAAWPGLLNTCPQFNDTSELRDLDEKVGQADAALKTVLDGASKLKVELKKWQDALENVGGEELRRQKSILKNTPSSSQGTTTS